MAVGFSRITGRGLMNDLAHTCFMCHRISCCCLERRRLSIVERLLSKGEMNDKSIDPMFSSTIVLSVVLVRFPNTDTFTFAGAMGLVLLYWAGEPKYGTGMMHQVRNRRYTRGYF